MFTTKPKRRSLTLKEKLKILQEVKDGKKQVHIASELNIPPSTISTIVKNEKSILGAVSSDLFRDKRKRMRTSVWPEVEKALIIWLQTARNQNIAVSGPLLKEKADELALKMQVKDFKASDGWLTRFKERHSLVFRSVSGEGAAVSLSLTEEWQKGKLQELLKEYPAKDIYNADETGLFFHAQPDKTLTFKNDSCTGGKKSKVRITIMVCSNMDGSEKIPLLVIGKSKKPRCFRGIQKLPTDYQANKKAWITQVLFEEWLTKLDRKFHQQKRKVLMLVDNCSAHGEVPDLLAIKLEFLPPNTTAVLQPMDQGIICQLKKLYRHKLLQKMLFCMDNGVKFEYDLLKAMHYVASAWSELPSKTIANCFRHAGFISDLVVEAEEQTEDITDKISEVLQEMKKKGYPLPENMSAADYIGVDDHLPVCATITDEEIVNQVLGSKDKDDDSEDDDSVCLPKPSKAEVLKSMDCLQRYFSIEEGFSDELAILNKLENKIVLQSNKCLKQTTVQMYFK